MFIYLSIFDYLDSLFQMVRQPLPSSTSCWYWYHMASSLANSFRQATPTSSVHIVMGHGVQWQQLQDSLKSDLHFILFLKISGVCWMAILWIHRLPISNLTTTVDVDHPWIPMPLDMADRHSFGGRPGAGQSVEDCTGCFEHISVVRCSELFLLIFQYVVFFDFLLCVWLFWYVSAVYGCLVVCFPSVELCKFWTAKWLKMLPFPYACRCCFIVLETIWLCSHWGD